MSYNYCSILAHFPKLQYTPTLKSLNFLKHSLNENEKEKLKFWDECK